MRQLWRASLVILLASAAMPAWGGVVIHQESKGAGSDEVVRIVTYLEPGRLRMEVESAAGSTLTIFRADRKVVWTIQPADKTYQEMTEADVEKLARQIEALRGEQLEMIKKLPPEERAAAEEMLKQMGSSPAPVSVKRLGPESLGPFSTTKYEIYSAGERTGEVWAAPLAQVNLEPAEYDTFVQFSQFFDKLSQLAAGGASAEVPGAYWKSIEGFPVKVFSYEEGELASEYRVIRTERQTLGDDKFQLPAGLRKLALPEPEP